MMVNDTGTTKRGRRWLGVIGSECNSGLDAFQSQRAVCIRLGRRSLFSPSCSAKCSIPFFQHPSRQSKRITACTVPLLSPVSGVPWILIEGCTHALLRCFTCLPPHFLCLDAKKILAHRHIHSPKSFFFFSPKAISKLCQCV